MYISNHCCNTLTANETFCTIDGLNPGTIYDLEVVAICKGEHSPIRV